MTDFFREPRYIVVKIKDLNAAGVTDKEAEIFNAVCDKAARYRASAGKPPLECVVVEADWRCYGHVWKMVETEHNSNEARKVCAAEGHQWKPLQVAGDGEYCTRCKDWRPE